MDDEKLKSETHKAFSQASYNAWFVSRIEKDKSIITISSGGIGLLAAAAISPEKISSISFLCGTAASVSFLVSIIVALHILEKVNTRQIENALNNSPRRIGDLFDKILDILFMLAIALTIVSFLDIAWSKRI